MNGENLCAVCAERLATVAGPESLTVGVLTIALTRRVVLTAWGNVIELTPTEYRLLVMLVAHHDSVVAYDTLIAVLREGGAHKDDRGTLKVHISRIRRACRRAGVELLLDNSREYGYTLKNAVEYTNGC